MRRSLSQRSRGVSLTASRPPTRLSQSSSGVSAPGRRQAMPMTAIGAGVLRRAISASRRRIVSSACLMRDGSLGSGLLMTTAASGLIGQPPAEAADGVVERLALLPDVLAPSRAGRRTPVESAERTIQKVLGRDHRLGRRMLARQKRAVIAFSCEDAHRAILLTRARRRLGRSSAQSPRGHLAGLRTARIERAGDDVLDV